MFSDDEVLREMQWWTCSVYNIGKYLDECVHVNTLRAPALHFLTKSHVYHFKSQHLHTVLSNIYYTWLQLQHSLMNLFKFQYIFMHMYDC